MKRSIVAAAVCSTVASGAGAFEFQTSSGGRVVLYGLLTPSLVSFDDGFETETVAGQNLALPSRLGVFVDQPTNAGMLQFRFETGLGFPGISGYAQDGDDPDWEWDRTQLRKVEVSYAADFGTLWLGQGSMATDGAAGVDPSGTTMSSTPAAAGDTAGGFVFRNDATGALTDVAIGDVFNDFDGPRRFRVRYDTPSFEGFGFSVAYGTEVLDDDDDDTYYDAAIRYQNVFGDFEVEGAIGYAWRDRDEGGTDENWVGSVAVMHAPTGLNGVLAFGGEKDGGEYLYVKGGWVAEFFPVGNTAFSIDFYDGSDLLTDGSESRTYGLHASQSWDDLGFEGYLGFRWYEYEDNSGIDYADATSILAGLVWRF